MKYYSQSNYLSKCKTQVMTNSQVKSTACGSIFTVLVKMQVRIDVHQHRRTISDVSLELNFIVSGIFTLLAFVSVPRQIENIVCKENICTTGLLQDIQSFTGQIENLMQRIRQYFMRNRAICLHY